MNGRRAALRAAVAAAAAGLAGRPRLGIAAAASPTLPRPRSLRAELEKAAGARLALVVMVSLEHCPYCKLVREGHLVPLAASGQPVVQIELTGAGPLADLQGRESTHRQVAADLAVGIAPTVLFLGRDGSELAERLVGMASVDFYGAYLLQRLDVANRLASGPQTRALTLPAA